LGGLLFILCIGGGVFLVNNLGNGGGKADPTTTPTATAPAANVEPIDCEKMKGDPLAPVEAHLKKDGYRVKVTEVDDPSRRGTVLDVPCSAEHGSEVEVKISNGRGRGNDDPTASCTPGFTGGLAPGRNCPPSAPR
jgi:hypothetical protein